MAKSDGVLAVELKGIDKHFPGVIANHDVDLRVKPGTIHAVVGENGAFYMRYDHDKRQLITRGVAGEGDPAARRERLGQVTLRLDAGEKSGKMVVADIKLSPNQKNAPSPRLTAKFQR